MKTRSTPASFSPATVKWAIQYARINIILQTRHLPWRSPLNVCKCPSLNSEKCALIFFAVLKTALLSSINILFYIAYN